MIDMEKRASAHLPAAPVWLQRGERLADTAVDVARGLVRALRRLLAYIEGGRARRAALRELYGLDDRLLADIGLRRDQVAGLVDDMFRGGDGEAAAGPIHAQAIAGAEDITEVNAGNDAQYRSAA